MAGASVTIDRTTSPRRQLVLAVELDELKIISALIDESARIVATQVRDLPGTSVVRVAAAIADAALKDASSLARGEALIRAIGICVPGQVDPATLRVSSSEVLPWNRVALKPALERALEGLGVDIRTPSSMYKARAARLTTSQPLISLFTRRACEVAGEVWAGIAKGRRDVVFISIGLSNERSIEAGIMVNGAAVRGSSGLSGMIWRFAGESSANGLLRKAIEALPGAPMSVLTGIIADDPLSLNARTIIHAARGGDRLALALVSEFCNGVGRLAANLISLLNPEMVVIGGELGLELKPFISQIRRAIAEWAHSDSGRRSRITFSTLGGRGRLLGAARLALSENEPPSRIAR
jgi:glucokinase